MLYSIWLHVHRNAYGNGEKDLSNGWVTRAPSLFEPKTQYAPAQEIIGDKQTVLRIYTGSGEPLFVCLSSSHRSFTILARTPTLTDEGCNAICEQCGGPTRRTRDMMTVAECWAERHPALEAVEAARQSAISQAKEAVARLGKHGHAFICHETRGTICKYCDGYKDRLPGGILGECLGAVYKCSCTACGGWSHSALCWCPNRGFGVKESDVVVPHTCPEPDCQACIMMDRLISYKATWQSKK